MSTGQESTPGFVSLRGVSKNFDGVTAVNKLDLDIPSGEFFSMLGPSGSGKTTVLRMIAGFETVTAGKISIDGEDVTELAPFDRTVNTVFQDYALFPHMTIQENVEYGLRTRREPKAQRAEKALEAIDRVKLAHLANQLPHQLSGGQRQRIALARALVLRPKVLLLDEPLGALDKQLREKMQIELKSIQREAGITFIFVTHDQEEAMTMSDRIAVFNEGRIEQLGTPVEVYEKPASSFVAGFLGVSNLLSGDQAKALVGRDELVNLRPERLRLHASDYVAAAGETTTEGVVTEVIYTGAHTNFVVQAQADSRLIATSLNEESPEQLHSFVPGDKVVVAWRNHHVATIPA
ncbi:spermidine/putrescine ABC transporter ATP-binding protein [Pontimonas salivibrio]|uniref:Spermidine/putrescine ABC transporter ATP-binding protein n=1 Tax=Pontimonas salivibrio TaxID=1159327 RepID=A0A2L2BRA5_9MICO|nr:ABC transporter ATP-binding protein [Pontimonas salivibrio]AVG24195.1 spermidine/putrescine ABC transporter ATP-binding protein [Pontimonas salivibrio]